MQVQIRVAWKNNDKMSGIHATLLARFKVEPLFLLRKNKGRIFV